MNEELLHLYRRMTASQRGALQRVFSDSPKTLRLVALLEQTDGDDFKTAKAVNFIYAEERKEVAYHTLVNRFYKLRQSLKEWLLAQLQQSEECFAPDEQALGFARLLVTKNEYGYALPRLRELEERCSKDEIYELLPEILLLLLRCVQSIEYTNVALQEEYEQKLLQVIDNQRNLQQLQYHHRRSFRVSQHFQESLAEVRKIHEKNKNSIRFLKIYHYTAFSRGVFLMQPEQQAGNALSRHLNRFLELQNQYPSVPVVYYELNHAEKIQFDLQLCQAAFAFSRGNWAEALKAVEMRQQLRRQHQHLYPRLSESEYRNNISIYIINNEIDKALETCELLFEFYEQNSPDEQRYHGYLELTNVYIFAYPKTKICEKPSQHLQQLDKAIAVFDTPESQLQYSFLMGAKALFLMTLGYYKQALPLFDDKAVLWLFGYYGLDLAHFKAACDALERGNSSEKTAIKRQIKTLTRQRISPMGKAYYEWLLRFFS